MASRYAAYMTTILREKALVLLRQALNNPSADFCDAQWEAISRSTEKNRHK